MPTDEELQKLQGFTTVPAEQVEQGLLNKVRQGTTFQQLLNHGASYRLATLQAQDQGIVFQDNDDGIDESNPESLLKQWKAVNRELKAVSAAVETIQEEGDRSSVLSAAAHSGGSLQQAIMHQRIHGLQSRKHQLEELLSMYGVKPGEAAAAAGVGAGKHTLEKKKKRNVNFADLQEDDLFESAKNDRNSTGLIETDRDRLIRLGVLTPFDRLEGFERRVEGAPGERPTKATMLESVARLAEKQKSIKMSQGTAQLIDQSDLPAQERHLKRVDEAFWRQSTGPSAPLPLKKGRKRAKALSMVESKQSRKRRLSAPHFEKSRDDDLEEESLDGAVVVVVDDDDDDDVADLTGNFDDADEVMFQQRQAIHQKNMKKQRDNVNLAESAEENEVDVVFQGGYRISASLYDKLFDYQKTGVKWMWELHTQRAGGIIGDDMGLGKTIQVTAFLAGLHHAHLFRPSLIVCPATVLRQWLREIRAWYPLFRVAILHPSVGGNTRKTTGEVVNDIVSSNSGILLTTYDQLRLQRAVLTEVEWGYCILDEGHKIRNPDAEVTLAAKQLQTVHRLIMTGSPIQNRLTELWSLFDFVFPGKLGTLPVFQAQFALPIQIGGYSNASALQVSTAYRCAVILRDLISPYLLRRRKADVGAALPKKTEQVLFCSLSQEQRDLYRAYLASKEAQDILAGNRAALAGIDILRKICNHPDLLERAKWETAAEYGAMERSGKLKVLDAVLQRWLENGNKALVFAQTQQMLDIIEKLANARGLAYHRMDGTTPVAQRASLIDDFNTNPNIFAFLLTTRVGGLGVNLTGADRCIIYDPDWNPSTDIQARERAWRIGQTKDVTVYRLITSGTIEEKIYHRQIYKQFLTDRVLRDPRQRRFFKAKDMADLFTLGDEYMDETADIFAGIDTSITDVWGEGNPTLQVSQREEEEKEEEEEEQADGGDSAILKELFEGSLGVRNALDHDKVEGASDHDKRAAEKEAANLARRAAEALRQSRLACQRAAVNEPTWTGRSGHAGASTSQGHSRFGAVKNANLQRISSSASFLGNSSPQFGGNGTAGTSGGVALSSKEIIARMQQREEAAVSAVRTDANKHEERAQRLAGKVASFLEERGGRASSEEVVSAFHNDIGPAEAALFRGVLKQVAVFNKRTKIWQLKSEFMNR